MHANDWLSVPVGIDAPRWVSRAGCRTVLVVVHTIASCHRLLDVVDYIESDPRVQVVFTAAPDVFNNSVPQHLHELGALVLPWTQAKRESFDLAITASHGGLHELHAPLVVMAHGAGRARLMGPGARDGAVPAHRPVYGLDAQRLTRDGRVLASAVLLSHDREREILQRQCPEALGVAVVAGDPCFDRLVASIPERARYRRALGVTDDQELVVVSSTWGPAGLFGHAPDLFARLTDELPAGQYRVAALLHPAVWDAHGRRQIRAWLRDRREAGLILLAPGADWRGMIIGADLVIGDHGSVTAYAAAIGRPVVHVAIAGPPDLAAGSAQELVTSNAGRLDLDRPILRQLRAGRAVDHRAVVAALTSCPGQAEVVIRRTMYELLRLAEPVRHRRVVPSRIPRVVPPEDQLGSG